jgi:hypothetical protein
VRGVWHHDLISTDASYLINATTFNRRHSKVDRSAVLKRIAKVQKGAIDPGTSIVFYLEASNSSFTFLHPSLLGGL